ncbi:MAG: hypothetical protein AAFS07_07640 [Pseudomonadota bacterium]
MSKRRRPVSSGTARIVTGVVLAIFLVVGMAGWQAVAKFNTIDACLDAGGAWHDPSDRCAMSEADWTAFEREGS